MNPDWWWREAMCAHVGPDIFEDDEYREAAKATCARCPVLGACMEALYWEEAGLARHEIHGVRAGMTPYRRWKLYGHLCPNCRGERDLRGKGNRLCTACQDAGVSVYASA